jgi:hypothetical protein
MQPPGRNTVVSIPVHLTQHRCSNNRADAVSWPSAQACLENWIYEPHIHRLQRLRVRCVQFFDSDLHPGSQPLHFKIHGYPAMPLVFACLLAAENLNRDRKRNAPTSNISDDL